MKKVYRAHPLMVFNFLKPFLFVLIFPFITAAIRYFTDRHLTWLFVLEMLAVTVVILTAIIRCIAFRLIIEDNLLTIKTGVLFIRKSKIRISRLSSIQTEQNPLDMLFRAATCRINTEAGVTRKSDFQFKLKLKEARELLSIIYPDKTISKVRFSAFKVAIMAAATSSAATGMILWVPTLRQIANLVGVGIDRALFDGINNITSRFHTYFPPIVNIVSLVILASYAVSFLYSFLKHINFKVSFGEKKIAVQSGFFVRTKTYFRRTRVNNIKIEQTPLLRLLHRYTLKVSVGGFDNSKSVSQVVVPSGKRRKIQEDFKEFFPFLTHKGKVLKPEKRPLIQNLFLMWPGIYLLLMIAAALISAYLFPSFSRLIQFLTIVCFGFLIIYTHTCLFEYNCGSLKLGDFVFAQSNYFLNTRELYCPKKNIGQLKITRFPMDRMLGICRIRLTVCSENADTIRVRHLKYDEAVKELSNTFELDEYFNTKDEK
ncbi:MAG: PH domain-containing protein [Clostridia bacterium]|nr:PH domain-containing protein [Clostridia bacterium]